MAAAVNSVVAQRSLLPSINSVHRRRPTAAVSPRRNLSPARYSLSLRPQIGRATAVAAVSAAEQDMDVIPVQSSDSTDHQDGVIVVVGREQSDEDVGGRRGLALESGGLGAPIGAAGVVGGGGMGIPAVIGDVDADFSLDRAINAAIVLAAGTFVITKLLTVDSDSWHGWTLFEILRYAPQHNWSAYEEALKSNPVLAKMMISGAVYSVGDWIAQCYEGKPLFDFDRARLFRSGLTGFLLHGSLSHYYYHFCEALFPFDDWWVVPAKVVFDQTVWSAIWNSIYFVVVAILRLESPTKIFSELKATFWPMLTAGWKLWPFAHLITYGVIPVEQRLLWVDCVELVWVTILSTYSNEKSEERNAEVTTVSNTDSKAILVEEIQK